MSRLTLAFWIALVALVSGPAGCVTAAEPSVAMITQPNRSPLISFRVLMRVGAMSDPQGKEGLAGLTAALLAKGGSRALSYDQILSAMYPMAASFDAQVDQEMTVFTGTTHRDNLDRYYDLIRQMLLDPGFREDDFARLKSEAVNFLSVSLREGNDEELGKEVLYQMIYRGHPYGHHSAGTVSALEKLTLDDVRQFYQQHYSQARVVVGLAGNLPAGFADNVRQDFAKLPAGSLEQTALSLPKLDSNWQVEIIARETRSTAISLGFPIDVVRGDPDWPALALINSYLGQHRSSNSHLYQRLREARGLNYGDYSYIEYFPRGMFQFQPDPNLGRREQIFQIWIRPVEPQNGVFALRAALFELDKLLRDGLSQETFEGTREFLVKYVNVLLQTQDARLGYALDSRFYRIPPFDEYFRDALNKLSLEQVNQVLRRRLKIDTLRIAIVTKDAAALRTALASNQPSPITYNSPKPSEILEEDKQIARFPLRVTESTITIRPGNQVFQ